ncbi:MAG: hypothetical protein QOG79_241, partial [Mycobacterium sp.]|nr:hypothetical protein [Mycobacterium sp.]
IGAALQVHVRGESWVAAKAGPLALPDRSVVRGCHLNTILQTTGHSPRSHSMTASPARTAKPLPRQPAGT